VISMTTWICDGSIHCGITCKIEACDKNPNVNCFYKYKDREANWQKTEDFEIVEKKDTLWIIEEARKLGMHGPYGETKTKEDYPELRAAISRKEYAPQSDSVHVKASTGMKIALLFIVRKNYQQHEDRKNLTIY